jgi:hypothetical protein
MVGKGRFYIGICVVGPKGRHLVSMGEAGYLRTLLKPYTGLEIVVERRRGGCKA